MNQNGFESDEQEQYELERQREHEEEEAIRRAQWEYDQWREIDKENQEADHA
jgi:hypothetical protein